MQSRAIWGGSKSFLHIYSSRRAFGMAHKLDIKSKYRLNSGEEIPVLGFGVYQTPAKEAESVVLHALRSGFNHVDSATAYRNEKASAAGIHAFVKEKGLSRSDFFFTSKVSVPKMSYEGAKGCVDETLRQTGLQYIDLYLLHAPYGGKAGRLAAWQALADAVQEGKVKSIGVSNYGVHHLNELEQYIQETDAKNGKGSGGVLSVNQVEVHPWLPRSDILDWCENRGVIVEAYSPLVRGERAHEPVLDELSKKHNKTWAQILLRWSLQQGLVLLPKSVTPARIEQNAQIYDFELDDEDMGKLKTNEYAPCGWDPTKEP